MMKGSSWRRLLHLLSIAWATARAETVRSVAAEVGAGREVLKAVLPVSPDRFLRAFILDEGFTETIFKRNKDIDICVGAWAKSTSGDGIVRGGGYGGKGTAMARDLEYLHPVKSRFPGMPSHARTIKRQTYAYNAKSGVLDLWEDFRLEGIPKADYFNVQTEWTVRSLRDGRGGGKGKQAASEVRIVLRVNFVKNTVLRGRIESSTFSEQGDALRDWISAARSSLQDDAETPVGAGGGFPPLRVGGFSSTGSSGGGVLARMGQAGSALGRKMGKIWKRGQGREGVDEAVAA